MIQATSINCSPIKPAVSFGKKKMTEEEIQAFKEKQAYRAEMLKEKERARQIQSEKILAAAELLGDTQSLGDVDSDTINQFKNLAVSGMNPESPWKTFTEGAAIVGAGALTAKALGGRAFAAISKNSKLVDPVAKKFTNFISNTSKKLAQNPKLNDKNKKGFMLRNYKKLTDWLERFSKRGIENELEGVETRIKNFKNNIVENTKKEATKYNKELTKEELAKAIEVAFEEPITKEALEKLIKERDALPGTNALKKLTGDVFAGGAGLITAKEVTTDKNGDGIPDRAQNPTKSNEKITRRVIEAVIDSAA